MLNMNLSNINVGHAGSYVGHNQKYLIKFVLSSTFMANLLLKKRCIVRFQGTA